MRRPKWQDMKKSTPEQEQQFAENLQREGVTFKEKFLMLMSAYLVILVPCALILIGMCLLAMLFFRAL